MKKGLYFSPKENKLIEITSTLSFFGLFTLVNIYTTTDNIFDHDFVGCEGKYLFRTPSSLGDFEFIGEL